MKISSIIVFLLVFIVTGAVAGNSPSETAKQFCQKDFEGVRLSSKTWGQIAPLITWEYEQGWDVVTAISSYKILSEEIYGDRAIVKVEFQHESGTTNKSINLLHQAAESTWKILSPIYQPHISQVLLCEQYAQCN